ncbi:caspase family protein [Pyxidicoccus fallax]|uniref:Caspase family protein n=1 Tax=Pyxidicoccus fallax TaxID=394095 RepID=A0A848LD12_9BACT|nr:caspase family protein [Pyxidicoccus fallax]NPC78160.1 caspase family protein [Pyxidicoccus fallax]
MLASGAATPAAATSPASRTASFALIIGVNRGHEPDQPVLRYADDDAARYLDLFRLLGARTYLLARLDDNTRRLHPQAAAEAQDPKRAELAAAVKRLSEDIALARSRGVEAVAYVVYAGHGNVRNGEGYVSLEDGPLTAPMLSDQVVGALGADRVHLIVDACYSYFLAYSRGPGGQRRPLPEGFTRAVGLAQADNVGLLLSTSSARESHEWEAFQAGVFNHEVRSGLFGAADADGDGQVSYREIAAFVERANAAIPNDRFRPQVHARPPKGSEQLVDLRPGLERRLEVDGSKGAHYVLEDANGVRLAEFHNAPGQSLRLLRPPPRGPVFLWRVGDATEFPVPAAPDVVSLDSLSAEPVRVASRGAAHTAFQHIFTLPFGQESVAGFQFPPLSPLMPPEPGARGLWAARKPVGWSALAAGAAAAGVGLWSTLEARDLRDGITPSMSQAEAASRNRRIRSLNTRGGLLYGLGGAAALGGALLLLWPRGETVPLATASPDGAALGVAGAF